MSKLGGLSVLVLAVLVLAVIAVQPVSAGEPASGDEDLMAGEAPGLAKALSTLVSGSVGLVALFLLEGARFFQQVTMSWSEFLRYAAGTNGVAVIVGFVLSEVVEQYVPGFTSLTSKWRRVVFFLLCLVLPLAASALGVLTAGWEPTWEVTFWPAIVAGVLAFGAGTVNHTRRIKERPRLGTGGSA